MALGLVAVAVAVLLRQYRPEYALMVSLLFSVLVFWGLLTSILPVTQTIQSMLESAGGSIYIETLLKALGLSFLTEIASQSCKDAGESAIATKIELAGRISLVLLSLPLFSELLRIALRFMSL